MEGIGTSNLTEDFIFKKTMDMQIGALNVERATPHSKSTSVTTSSALRHLDPETDYKVRRIASQVNESIHLAANEPSLGLYRIQEHIYRTVPPLVSKKNELKSNLLKVEGASYDLGLSMHVVKSISSVKNFTCIQEALKTAIEMKRKLNIIEEQRRARQQLDIKQARQANKSISLHEPAEGYICPVCYFALHSQDELILHWQKTHSLDNYDNEVFQELEVPDENADSAGQESQDVISQENDMTVIDMPQQTHVSECEDVVQSFNDFTMVQEVNEHSASEGSE